MTRRMTQDEALAFIETAFNVGPDGIADGLIDATVADMDVERAQTDLESYLSFVPAEIDPDSIEIHSDRMDDSDMPAVRIIIKTGIGA